MTRRRGCCAGVLPGRAHPQLQRITWTPAGSEVTQRWEQSDDQGLTWQTVFDGRYRRAASREAPPWTSVVAAVRVNAN